MSQESRKACLEEVSGRLDRTSGSEAGGRKWAGRQGLTSRLESLEDHDHVLLTFVFPPPSSQGQA